MLRKAILSAALTFTASGCAALTAERPDESLRPIPLEPWIDPLSPERPAIPWRPPRQMAVYIHPHEDPAQGILIGGHWILVLLGDGSWYFEDQPDRDPVPDAEAGPEEKRAAVGTLEVPAGAVVPYRAREEKK
jgi:hypothetical protein